MKFPALCLATFALCVLPGVQATTISEDFDGSDAMFHNGFADPCGSPESDHCVDLGMDGDHNFNLGSSDDTYTWIAFNAMTAVAAHPDWDPAFIGNNEDDQTNQGNQNQGNQDPGNSDPPAPAVVPEPSTLALAGFVLLGIGALLRRERRV